MPNGVKITGYKAKQAGPGDKYSLAFDFSEMNNSGIWDDVKRSYMPVEITTPDGKYITSIRTDTTCVTDFFYSKKEEDVIAWAGSGDWEVIEEYELILDEYVDNHEEDDMDDLEEYVDNFGEDDTDDDSDEVADA